MSLPKHVKLADCLPDPGKRANHIYFPKTDEVFHVSPELAASVLKLQAKTPAKGKASETATAAVSTDTTETSEAQTSEPTGLTVKEADEDSNQGTVEINRAELLSMATSLELTIPEEISDADLMALVEKAVQE